MEQNMKKNLHAYTMDLEDRVGFMRIHGENEEVIELLDRTANIGNISILNFDAMNEDELGSVLEALKLGEDLAKSNTNTTSQSLDDLSRVIGSLEDLFRAKKLLLDSNREHSL